MRGSRGLIGGEEGSIESWNLALPGRATAVRWVARGVSLQSDFMPVCFASGYG